MEELRQVLSDMMVVIYAMQEKFLLLFLVFFFFFCTSVKTFLTTKLLLCCWTTWSIPPVHHLIGEGLDLDKVINHWIFVQVAQKTQTRLFDQHYQRLRYKAWCCEADDEVAVRNPHRGTCFLPLILGLPLWILKLGMTIIPKLDPARPEFAGKNSFWRGFGPSSSKTWLI